jgi:signal transduction histidine kinase
VDRDRIQVRIGTLILVLASLAFVNLLVHRLLVLRVPPDRLITDPSFVILLASLAYFGFATFRRTRVGKAALALGVFVLSGPIIYFNGSTDYFGLAVAVMGVLLLYRFEFLASGFLWKVGALIAWVAVSILLSDQLHARGSINLSLSYILFLLVNLLMFYILFEEEIRGLMAVNRHKDAELAAKSQKIAELEPLSVLGERIAHVAHSFKNNLNQITLAELYLEQQKDPGMALATLEGFRRSMSERIDNILMISQAGFDLEPELFDVARALQGIHQVYLTGRSFTSVADTELTITGPVWVRSVRWDFLLMVENILKNAAEALGASGKRGLIRVTLDASTLTMGNNGGAIEVCPDCRESCLDCSRYGRPGRTNKAGGSGHGLAQVFATCRQNGWQLRVTGHDDWTEFIIRFPDLLSPVL